MTTDQHIALNWMLCLLSVLCMWRGLYLSGMVFAWYTVLYGTWNLLEMKES